MPTPASPPASVAERALPSLIGAQVKGQRTARKLSMRALAAAAGVSQPFLSKLENGQLLPSMSTLYALAAALEIPPTELMPEVSGSAEAQEPVHFPVANLAAGAAAAGEMQLLSGGPGRRLEAYRFVVQPGYQDDSEYRHEGEEFVFVLRGIAVLSQTGLPDRILKAGDSITVDPTIGHRWSVPADAVGETEYLLTCTTT